MNDGYTQKDFYHLEWEPSRKTPGKLSPVLDEKAAGIPISHHLASGKSIEIDLQKFSLHITAVSSETVKPDTEDKLYWFTLDIDLDRNEKIWGTGQDPLGRIDHRNSARFLWNQFGTIDHASNIGFPFFYSSKGYGLMVASTGAGKMVFGKGDECPESELAATLCPIPEKLKREEVNTQGGARIIICDSALTFYIWKGCSPEELLSGYYYLTGLPLLPPKWAFGYLQSRNRYRSQEEVSIILDGFKKRSIPVEALIIDWLWFRNFGDLSWNLQFFSDPQGMIDGMHERKVKLMLALHPFFDEESRLFGHYKEQGVLNKVPVGGRSTFDFSHPEAADVWIEGMSTLFEQGIDGYWADMGEPEEDLPGTVSAVGDRLINHNQYSLLWAKTLFQGHVKRSRKKEHRVFQLHRSGAMGMHRYGTGIWSGDIASRWSIFEEQIRVGLGMCASGFPFWCTDIGGFFSGVTGYEGYHGIQEFSPELYIRWFQYGTFCPIFRSHGTRPGNEPWSFGEETEAIVKKYINLRYRLAPYIMNAVYATCEKGIPLMRPLFFDFPDDDEASMCDDQFLFGSSMMVAPVSRKGERSKQVYLPAGVWYDFWTGDSVTGPAHITVSAPLGEIPLFVKAGAIIPVCDVSDYADIRFEDLFEKVTVIAFPGVSNEIVYRDELGKGYSYEPLEVSLQYDDVKKLLLISEDKKKNSRYNLRPGDFCTIKNIGVSGITLHFQTMLHMKYPDTGIVFDIDYNENGRTLLQGTFSKKSVGLPYRFKITPPAGWTVIGPLEFSGKASINTSLVWKLLPVSMALPLRYSVFIEGEIGNLPVTKKVEWGSGWATRFSMIGPLPIEEEDRFRKDGIDSLLQLSNWQYHANRAFPCYGYVNLRRVGLTGTAATAEKRKLFSALACAYSALYVDESMEVLVEYGGEDHLTIWLNNEKIIVTNEPVPVIVHEKPVLLKKGKNQLLVMASIHTERPSSARELGFYFRFLRKGGTLAHTIRYSPAMVN